MAASLHPLMTAALDGFQRLATVAPRQPDVATAAFDFRQERREKWATNATEQAEAAEGVRELAEIVAKLVAWSAANAPLGTCSRVSAHTLVEGLGNDLDLSGPTQRLVEAHIREAQAGGAS